MTWWDYVQRVTRGEMRQIDIADAIGVNQGTVSRWKNGHAPSADAVIDFARTFQVSPLEALYEAGVLRKDELGKVVELMQSTETLTNERLVALIAERLGIAGRGRRDSA